MTTRNNITTHRIYSRLFHHLSGYYIRNRKTNKVLPFIFPSEHIFKRMDVKTDGIDLARTEAELMEFAEKDSPIYEVVCSVPQSLYFSLKETNEVDLIFKKSAVAVPNFIFNATVCNALENEFSVAEILSCNGFVLREDRTRLDISEHLVRRGFITPVINEKTNLINGLRVFRHPKDEKPFILRSRSNSFVSGGIN